MDWDLNSSCDYGTRIFFQVTTESCGSCEGLKGNLLRKSLWISGGIGQLINFFGVAHMKWERGFMNEGSKVTKKKHMFSIENHMVNMRDIGIPEP